MSRVVLISAAINGARRTKADHPALPITPAEIAREAEACRAAGAGLLHLHVRDDAGGHSLDPRRYDAAIEAIRSTLAGDMMIQITTEACGVFDVEAQMACVRGVVPPAASFAVREFFAGPTPEVRVRGFFRWVAETRIIPQFILYTPDEVDRLHRLLDDGDLPFADPAVLFVLGRYADGPASDPRQVMPFVDRWRDRAPWSVCAFGQTERAVAAAAIALGGHARVGFENNLLAPDGSTLRCTAEQVAAVGSIARTLGFVPGLG